MAFRTPTLDEQHAFLIAHRKATDPDVDVSEMATENLWLQTQAAGVTDNHAHVEAVKNDLMPDTAAGAELVRWANLRGVRPKGATPARKAAALRVFGLVGTDVPDGTTLRHVSTLRFKTIGDEVIGSSGYVDCDVVAIDVGSATRLSAGEILTLEQGVAGLQDDAELQLALDEDGTDKEGDDQLSKRVVSRFQNPPRGGTRVDYQEWALEVTGIAAAYAYPLRGGLGTVHLAALHAGSGPARILTTSERLALQALIDAQKRSVSVKGFLVLEVIAEPADVEVAVMPDGEPEHEFDWDDVTPPQILTWDAATRRLVFTADRPSTMTAGHRLTLPNGATGAERVIESLDPGAADAVYLEADAAGDTPIAGGLVYAGGPLVAPARAAIRRLIDSLGTANPDSVRWGPWEGNLRPGKISGTVEDIDGVLQAETITPASVVEAGDPAYPENYFIGLITPGRIIVRRRH